MHYVDILNYILIYSYASNYVLQVVLKAGMLIHPVQTCFLQVSQVQYVSVAAYLEPNIGKRATGDVTEISWIQAMWLKVVDWWSSTIISS